jgi:nucleoid DNA-binding protein
MVLVNSSRDKVSTAVAISHSVEFISFGKLERAHHRCDLGIFRVGGR